MKTLEQWQQNGQFFDFGEHRIFYQSSLEPQSNKPVLLLIHGFPTCSWDWAKIWPTLTERFQLIAPDMLGFGFSDKPKTTYSILHQADLCEQLLAHLGLNSFHILAHDYGDTVAQELMSREHLAPHIHSVVFSNGGLFPEAHQAVLVQKLLLSPIGFVIARLMSYRKFKQNFDKICAKPMSDTELTSYWQAINHHDGRKVFPSLIGYMPERIQYRDRWVNAIIHFKAPVYLINGELDPISGGHMADRYEQLIPHAQVARLPDTGHYPQVESPEEFVQHAIQFWDTLSANAY